MKYVRQDNGQIRAMANFALHDGTMIVRGTLGGTVANYRNLAQGGKCWVLPGGSIDDDAFVSGNAVVLPGGEVLESAKVYGNAVIDASRVSGNARVLGNSIVQGGSLVEDDAMVYGDVLVTSGAQILGRARVQGDAEKSDGSKAVINGGTVKDDAKVSGRPMIQGLVEEEAKVSGCPFVCPASVVTCNARLAGCVRLINTKLGCGAIVYGDQEVVGQIVEDASYVTTCPDKGSESCC